MSRDGGKIGKIRDMAKISLEPLGVVEDNGTVTKLAQKKSGACNTAEFDTIKSSSIISAIPGPRQDNLQKISGTESALLDFFAANRARTPRKSRRRCRQK